MAVSAGCTRGTETNTPATDSLKPARGRHARRPTASTCSSASTTRRSCSSTPTGSTTLPLQREDAHLAPLPGGARRPRHLLRPALRAQPRDARRARGDPHAPGGRRSGDARRDPALHEAVLDQHRAVQQPHRAQVRAEVHAGGVRGGRARGRSRPARRFRCEPGETLDAAARAPAAAVLRPDVDPIVTNKTPGAGQGHPHGERQQPLRRRDDEGPRGLRGAVSAQLAAGEAATASSSKRSTASADATTRRSARSSATSRRRSRLRPTPMADGAARARSRSTRPARRPTARPTTSPGCRTRRRRSTRSTASSRSTSTRAA